MAASWWEQEADSLGKRVAKRDPSQPVLLETGYGPSGLPHLGTFAEVARTSFVKWAFERKFPDRSVRLVAFSDDMDGLRSVPENLPNREMVAEHLGKPLSRIPDPFGTSESFSANMVGRLRNFLNEYGFDVEFMTSSECYSSGRFDEGLLALLRNDEKVKSVVLPTLQPETRKTWSPFLPICEKCGRYTTEVTGIDPEAGTVDYVCHTEFGGSQGCGHRSTVPVTGGRVKVGWKVDWALRWKVLGVDYEMYGKDLIESAKVSSKICRIIGGKPPTGTFYELFLDDEGHKISKKIGNGIALDDWRRYSPDDAILYFLTKPPRKARRIGLELVGKCVDELLGLFRQASEHAELIQMLSETATAIDRPHGWTWSSGLDFGLVTSLVAALGVDDPEAIYAFIQESPAVPLEDADRAFARQMIDFAVTYSEALAQARREQPRTVDIDDVDRAAMSELSERLEDADFTDVDSLQKLTFEIGKKHERKMKAWFAALYFQLTGNIAGPRLGTLLGLLGRERAMKLLRG